MAGEKHSVLNIPLPAFAGGGFCTIAICEKQEYPGHVALAVTSRFFNGVVQVPAKDAEAFGYILHGEALAQRLESGK